MPESLFPKEITHTATALDVGKLAWRKLLKISNDSSTARVEEVEVSSKEEGKVFRHKYVFTGVVPQNLLGIFASALENINLRRITYFDPKTRSLTVEFSSEVIAETDDE